MLSSSARTFVRLFSVFSIVCSLCLGSLTGVSLAQGATENNVEYVYDDLGRLIEVVYGNEGKVYRYTYDDAGNRTEHEVSDFTGPLVRLWNTWAFEGRDLYFGVWRVGGWQTDITVNYETYVCTSLEEAAGHCDLADQATAVDDYTPTTGSLVIPGGSIDGAGRGGLFSVPVVIDELEEPEERVYVRLTSVVGGRIDPNRQHSRGRILDANSVDATFTISRTDAPEGSPVQFKVSKIGTAAGNYEVTFKTVNATAHAGEDYLPVERTLTFNENVTDQYVTVETVQDNVYESDEQLIGMLVDATNGATITKEQQKVTIFDREDLPKMLISSGGIREATTWIPEIGHTFWIDKDTTQPVGASYTVCHTDNKALPECQALPESAKKGISASIDDFIAGTQFSGSITMPAGSSVDDGGDLFFTMQGDTVEEPDERYVVVLHSFRHAKADDQRYYGYGVIRNDDSSNSIYNIFGNSAEAGQPLTFTVKRWGNTSGTKTVHYKVRPEVSTFSVPSGFGVPTRGKAAVLGTDYTIPYSGAHGTLTFSSGQTEQTFTIPTLARPAGSAYTGPLNVPVEIFLPDGSLDHITVTMRWGVITDSAAPKASVASTSALESAGALAFPVTVDRPSDTDIVVTYTTDNNGSASVHDFEHIQGSVVIPAGSTTGPSIIVPIIDDVDQASDEGNETVGVRISSYDVEIASGSAMGTIVNDANDACNTLAGINAGNSTFEDSGGQIIGVNIQTGNCPVQVAGAMPLGGALALSGAPGETVHEYRVDVVSGSAEADKDFESKSVIIGMTATINEQQIPLEIIDDLINEKDEDLTITVTPLAAGDIGTEAEPLVILDDDPGPVFSVSDVTVNEDNLIFFTVTKDGQTDRVAAVTYATADGTAISGSDYVPASGILTFAANETSKQITVSGVGDSAFETEEMFYLNLSAPTAGAAIQTEQATATIIDDDTPPMFAITDATATEGNDLTFKVILTEPSAFEHSVRFTTEDGSATDGEDYIALAGDLIFAPGDTEHTITIKTIDDTLTEGSTDETLFIALSNPTNGAQIGDLNGKGSIEDGEAETSYTHICEPNWDLSRSGSAWSISAGGTGVSRASTVQYEGIVSDTGVTSGRWYWEVTVNSSPNNGSQASLPGVIPWGQNAASNELYKAENVVSVYSSWGTINGRRGIGIGNGNGTIDIANYNSHSNSNNRTYGYYLNLDNMTLRINAIGYGWGPNMTISSQEEVAWYPAIVDRVFHASADYTFNFGATSFINDPGASWLPYNLACGQPDFQIRDGADLADGVIPNGRTHFDVTTDKTKDYFIPAGSDVILSIAGGAGGTGSGYQGVAGYGGYGRLHTVFQNDAYIRVRSGAMGTHPTSLGDPAPDLSAGGAGQDNNNSYGSGGGASAIAMSSDGINWTPVLIAGGGGGSHNAVNYAPGGGLGLPGGNLPWTNAATPGTLSVAGLGSADGSGNNAGGSGGASGQSASPPASPAPYMGTSGVGETFFAVGGGGSGASSGTTGAAGGGSGYYGGGGGSIYGRTYGAGGSGYLDQAAIELFAGNPVTILENQSGYNAGDGYVEVERKSGQLVTATTSEVKEGQPVIFSVKADGFGITPIVLNYSLVDGTAAAGADYDAITGTITLAPTGETDTIVVPTLQDTAPEGDETFTLHLTLVSGNAELGQSAPIATIKDDDEIGAFTVTKTEQLVVAGGIAEIEIMKTKDLETSYMLAFSTTDGSATQGTDYTATNGIITFEPGEMTKLVPVQTLIGSGSTVKNFTFTFSDPSGFAEFGNTSTQVNISPPATLAPGITTLTPTLGENYIAKIPAGSSLSITLAGGAGGDGQYGGTVSPGGGGGLSTIELPSLNDLFVRSRIGRKGAGPVPSDAVLADLTAGGTGFQSGSSLGGQGGGATAIAVSIDGVVWHPVAVVGGGGGAGTYAYQSSYGPGAGGGINTAGENAKHNYQGGKGGSLEVGGAGGVYNSSNKIGGAGGVAGADATLGTGNSTLFGKGQDDFLIGGGGTGQGVAAGGGGSGYTGGGGGAWQASGGGGSGFYLGSVIEELTGLTPVVTGNQTGGNAGDGYIQFDYQPPATTTIYAANTIGVEGGAVNVHLKRIGDVSGIATITYSTTNGTAIAGSDYTGVSGNISFVAGETEVYLPLSILTDAISEAPEQFTLNLSSSNSGLGLLQTSVPITIIDPGTLSSTVTLSASDAAAEGGVLSNGDLTIVPTSMSAGDKDFVRATVDAMPAGIYYWEVRIDAPRSGNTSADFGLLLDKNMDLSQRWDQQGRQYAGLDPNGYLRLLGGPTNHSNSSISGIAAGSVVGIFYNTNHGNLYLSHNGQSIGGWQEADVVAGVNPNISGFDTRLVIPSYAADWGSSGQVTYRFSSNDFDYEPNIPYCVVGGPCKPYASISVAEPAPVQEGGTLEFVVAANGVSPEPIVIDFQTVDGLATAGADYAATSGQITLLPGQTSMTITVGTNDDNLSEGQESLFINLSVTSGSAILAEQTVAGAITDDESPDLHLWRSPSVLRADDATLVGGVLTNGGLTVSPTSMSAGDKETIRTDAPPLDMGGVYYWEIRVDSKYSSSSGYGVDFGLIADSSFTPNTRWDSQSKNFAMVSAWYGNLRKRGNVSSGTSGIGVLSVGDIVGVFFNSSSGKVYLKLNGVPTSGGWTDQDILAGTGTASLSGFDPSNSIPIYSVDYGTNGGVTYEFDLPDFAYPPSIPICIVGAQCQ